MSKRIVARRSGSYARPARVARGGERDPGAVHRVRERLRRTRPEQRAQHLGGTEVERVEDEADLEGVAGAQPGRRARRTRTCRCRAGAGACASASRMAGMRHHQSVSIGGEHLAGTGGRVRGPIGGQAAPGQPVGGRRLEPVVGDRAGRGSSSVTRSIEPFAATNSAQSSSVRPDDQVDVRGGARGDPVERVAGRTSPSITGCQGSVLATTSRPQRSGSGSARRSALSCGGRRQEPVRRHGGDRVAGRRARRARPRGVDRSVRARLGRSITRSAAPLCRIARRNSPSARGIGEQRADAHRAGGLAEDGDVGRVAPEGRDVVAHPLQRGDLVEQPEVRDRRRPGRGNLRRRRGS